MLTRQFLIILILSLSLIFLSGCYHIGAFLLLKPSKDNAGRWKSEKYKVCVQRRQDYVGPPFYSVKVKTKKMGGMYYKKIASRMVSGYEYQQCVFKLPTRKDSVTVDVCKKSVFSDMRK